MNYCVSYYRDGEPVAAEYFDEHPSEDRMDRTVKEIGADFADVCRLEDTQ